METSSLKAPSADASECQPVHPERIARRALEIRAQLLHLMSARQRDIAYAVGWHESKFSRWKNGEAAGMSLDEICNFLAALDVRIASSAGPVVSDDEMHALAALAERGLRALRGDLER